MAKRLHRIKEVLKEKEKSGYWLAKETGISYNSINAYVNDRVEPSLTNLFRIAAALKINPKELINSWWWTQFCVEMDAIDRLSADIVIELSFDRNKIFTNVFPNLFWYS